MKRSLLLSWTLLATVLTGCGPRRIETVGTGRVASPSDRMICAVSIHKEAKTLGEAFRAAEKTGREVVTAANKFVPAGSVSSQRIVVTQKQDATGKRLPSYEASLSISIVIDELSKRVELLDAVTAISDVELDSTEVTLQEPRKAADKARDAAVDAAKDKAEALAAKLGLKLGQVEEVQELPAEPSQNQMANHVEQAGKPVHETGELIPLGSLPVEARVRVVYDLR